jgi:hypothetical protein
VPDEHHSPAPVVDDQHDQNGRDRQADVILTAAVEQATVSIRRGRPGYARFQLEAARFRAQRVLDGTVPDGSTR